MKLFGVELKFNGLDVWHKGNLTKLSQLQNDLGASVKITVSATEPSTKASGDFWYKEV
nr:hypothetical protein [Fredinandcohnia onubensis]